MILDRIAERTVLRVKEEKRKKGLCQVRRAAEELGADTGFLFHRALEAPGISFICEVKKASPSRGVIAEEFPYLQIAREYEEAGAAAISVLTEPYYFLGSGRYLEEIAAEAGIPVLRKDFILDVYQIYEARMLGAAAVLLICALLEGGQLREYLAVAHSLGLSALVEVHTEEEAEMALEAGAGIIGVNNRNLKTFEVDIAVTGRLRRLIPQETLFVSESGIRTPEDIAWLKQEGSDGVLIGEALMRSADKRKELAWLAGKG